MRVLWRTPTDAAPAESPTAAALEDLRALIRALPVPTSPPDVAAKEGALGLALMDLSLRLDHLTRLTEHLTLVDRGHMARSVSVDIDLGAIPAGQREALAVPGEAGGNGHGPSLWVPVSRYSRRDLAPVVVRESTGEVLPRLTHRQSNRATVAAFVRLLSMLLDSHQDVTEPGTVVHQLRHTHQRSRWLLEAAIAELITIGSAPGESVRTTTDLARLAERTPGPDHRRATDSQAVRELALRGLDVLFPADPGGGTPPFAHLLQRACRQYELVVLLTLDRPRRFLTWEAPLLPARLSGALLQRVVRNALPVNREFAVEYETVIPRAVSAYHLTVQVNEEITVRRFLLSSDVDDEFVEILTEDMRTLAGRGEALGGGNRKLLELELQGIASRLAELGHRRLLDLTRYEAYIADCRGAADPAGRRPPDARRLTAEQAVDALCDGDCSVAVLAAFSGHYAADGLRHLARTRLAGPALGAAAAGLRHSELGYDITTDNDPRDHGAHAHWRRPSVDLSARSTEPVRAVAYLALADEAPALIESITRMVAGLALVVLGVGTLLTGGVHWLYSGLVTARSVPTQADAVVAVLLLVPGLLLARLDLPGTNTVLGQLRRFQRSLAVASVAVTTGLAIAVGTVDGDWGITRLFQVSLGALGLILLCCGCEFAARRVRRGIRVPRSAQVPRWLRATGPAPRRSLRPDAHFDARGEV